LTAQAVARARAAAQPSLITIGFTVNLIVTPAVRELRRQYPDADVRTLYLERNEPRAALLEHRVDAAVTRLPFPTDHLDVTVLYDEPRVLVVPLDHRLAGKESVTLDDIADEPLPRSLDPAWNAFRRIDPRPDGRPAPDGPLIKAVEDKTSSSPADRPWPSSRQALPSPACAPTSPQFPLRVSSPATSRSPPGPATAAASWQPSANAPDLT
jgi:DNA-binding transcriptional LysR family regulator